MAQDWASPTLAAAPTAAPSPHLLRPLTTGEVLDNTFSLYRSRFWLFAGLASLSGAWQVVAQGLQLLLHHMMLVHFGAGTARVVGQFNSLFSMAVMLPVSAVVHAAAVYALSEVYLGRGVTAGEALKATRSKWLRYVGIALWQGWAASWVALLLLVPAALLLLVPGLKSTGSAIVAGTLVFVGVLAGGIYGVIAYIRNSLAVPASVVEATGVRASMRRSKDLAAGTKGRIFVVLLIVFALSMVFGTIDAPLLILIARHPLQEHIVAQGVILLISFAAQTLIGPVSIIGLTLVYFDQRVRKEAFDLLVLLGPTETVVDPAPGLAVAEAAHEPALAAEQPLDPADPIGDDGRF